MSVDAYEIRNGYSVQASIIRCVVLDYASSEPQKYEIGVKIWTQTWARPLTRKDQVWPSILDLRS